MSLTVSYFVLSFFLRDDFDVIWDLIESVPVIFPTNSAIFTFAFLVNGVNSLRKEVAL